MATSKHKPKPGKPKPGKPGKPTAKPAPAKAKAKAATWAHDGALVVLAARGPTHLCLIVRDGKVVAEVPAISRAARVAALPSGAIVTMSGDGKGRIATAGGARSAHSPMSLVELVVCRGVAYAGGWHGQLVKLDEATATWTDMRLREALAPHLPADGPAAKGKIHSIIEGANGPIVGAYCTYHETVVFEHTGAAWTLRGKVASRVNALARDPDADIVYAIGSELTALAASGSPRRLAKFDFELWGAGWLSPPGELLVSDLWAASRLALDGTETPLVTGKRGIPDNHSLFVSGSRAAFVCDGAVHVRGMSAGLAAGRQPDGSFSAVALR